MKLFFINTLVLLSLLGCKNVFKDSLEGSKLSEEHAPGFGNKTVAAALTPAMTEDLPSMISLQYTDAENNLATSCSVTNPSADIVISTPCSCTTAGVCTVGITPNPHFNGAASFDYDLVVNSHTTNVAHAAITVAAVNDSPVILPITNPLTIVEDVPPFKTASIPFTITDVDNTLACSNFNVTMTSTRVSGVGSIPNINVSLTGTAPNCFAEITPNANANGTFNITFTVNDKETVIAPNNQTATQTFAVNITAVDDPEIANNITPTSFLENTQSIIQLSYSGVDGENATSCNIISPTNVTVTTGCSCTAGVCTVGVTGTLNYNGAASFLYNIVTTGSGSSNNATASLVITNVDNPPVASSTLVASTSGIETLVSLPYTDADGDLASSCNITNTTNLTVSTACLCAAGNCTVGVTTTAPGAASFDFTVVANSVTSNVATVSWTSLFLASMNNCPIKYVVVPKTKTQPSRLCQAQYTEKNTRCILSGKDFSNVRKSLKQNNYDKVPSSYNLALTWNPQIRQYELVQDNGAKDVSSLTSYAPCNYILGN